MVWPVSSAPAGMSARPAERRKAAEQVPKFETPKSFGGRARLWLTNKQTQWEILTHSYSLHPVEKQLFCTCLQQPLLG